MGQPFVGEIRMFAGNFAPVGYMTCEGQILPISENEVLFQLIGTTYGGNGQTTFALPNLASRVPNHQGTAPNGITYVIGEMAGTEAETLTVQQIPIHNHTPLCSTSAATTNSPSGNVLAVPGIPGTISGATLYGTDAPQVALNANSITPAGGSQPHENCQPFLCINFIIALFGVFPPPN